MKKTINYFLLAIILIAACFMGDFAFAQVPAVPVVLPPGPAAPVLNSGDTAWMLV